MSKYLLTGAAALSVLLPNLALACACGCGVFDVGTGTMMPTEEGGTAWLEYDLLNQSQNWSGTSKAPEQNNDDKALRTSFFKLGAEYMFNRSWGMEAEVPFTNRFFKTTDEDTGDINEFHHAAFGDVHLKAVYSGLSDDMSSGITFGTKLPTGDFSYSGFDRDTAIGSGSTDLLLGAYHMGDFGTADVPFNWFVNGEWDQPVLIQDHYRPGPEYDASVGSYYNAGTLGAYGKIAPLLQLIGSYRVHDTGINANPSNSGYSRLLISPGVEYDINAIKLYGDVEIPIYQHINGNQLVSPVQFKFIVGYSF
jgi:hypothetical protein